MLALRCGAALGTPAPLLDRVEGGEPLMALLALPVELGLAVGITPGEASAAALGGDGMQRSDGVTQLLVRAALAPVALPDGMRHRAPPVPLCALPFHERQAVDVGLGDELATTARRVGADFIEGQFAHGQLAK